jgi:hypothetical protein
MRATWPTSNRVEKCPAGVEPISAIVLSHFRHA